MLRHSDWFTFLRNGHNKTELIRALVHHFKSIDVRKKLLHPIIVTEEEKTWSIAIDGILRTSGSNHVEVDIRIIMEAVKLLEVVKAGDTGNILDLMCYAHSHERKANQWIMQINSESFVSVNSIEAITMGQRFVTYCQQTIVSLVVTQNPT